ncbi:MAG: uroporphyrinogen decarboxylase family protein [Bacteroidales bacterium]|jgi:uroporphyrinogen decarboxylase
MKGKELIKKAFNMEVVDQTPWVPFVGVHAAYLLGLDSSEYLKSKALIVKGVSNAIDKYGPDGIPIVFDLQLEAEVLGCELLWAKENPPSVKSHPLANGIALNELKVPESNQGRIGVVMEATRELRKLHPDIALYGLITGPFTLALHLLGTDIFMQMFMDQDNVHKIMRFCTDVSKAMSSYYIESGCDVIAVVDPMTSQIGPDQFNSFVKEYVTEIFTFIKEKKSLSSFFVCGHAQHNIEVMCECNPDNISIDENIPLEYVKDICLERGISFGGNLKLTVTLLMGDVNDCEIDAVYCMDTGGNKGFILSPGCDLPYSAKEENMLAISRLITDTYRKDITRTIKSKSFDFVPINLEEYGSGPKIKIDLITLDSSSCAPCQYMVNAVNRAAEPFKDLVEIREYKIKEKEGVDMMCKLGVKNIPTICIDGEVKFISNIPPVESIREVILSRIEKKAK